ncbi:hypothetical protein EV401DRAFT_1891754 [Pisolithus croceorrhizus]|nr:hypothetical protein EV401DRAFT_1891754 [Pisolithus croceorrhizus]
MGAARLLCWLLVMALSEFCSTLERLLAAIGASVYEEDRLRDNLGAFKSDGSPDNIPHHIAEPISFCDDPDIRPYSADIHDAYMRYFSTPAQRIPVGTSSARTSRSQDLGPSAQLSIVLAENFQPRALPPKLPA